MTGPSASSPPPVELSVVLPVYQEERVLEGTLAQLLERLPNWAGSFEILVVDDGSTDRSLEIARAAAEQDDRIVVQACPENRGKGNAVRVGMRAARGARRVFLDADLSTPLDELAPLLAALEQADVALGSRRAPGAEISVRQPRLRESLGRGFTLLTRTLLAPGVSDFTCGLKGFRGPAAESIFAVSRLDGWAFDAELVTIARTQGHQLSEVPVHWHHEEDSKVRLVSAVLVSLRDLGRICLLRARGAYRRPEGL